ncbi:MAG: exosortase system-associated protein, TIGR04073 family [Candidatus Omnitrophica bacterium]|nr:exosortase system-associated protein, TIGR04073 family [Candidatus Omnitrophota bacterium]MDD5488663.1 exosortase system-associated protein, TIGR04073 family [Candidatus Omnitrophota bacterium]
MKKCLISMMILCLLVSVCGVAGATDTPGPVTKLGRGLTNILTSPLFFFKGINDVSEEKGLFAGTTLGILQGVIEFGKRVVVGAYETVSFPVPAPEGYAPILTDPEYLMQP